MKKISAIGLTGCNVMKLLYLVQNLASPFKKPMSTIIQYNLPIWREYTPLFKQMRGLLLDNIGSKSASWLSPLMWVTLSNQSPLCALVQIGTFLGVWLPHTWDTMIDMWRSTWNSSFVHLFDPIIRCDSTIIYLLLFWSLSLNFVGIVFYF